MENVYLVESDKLQEKIMIIIRQTNYTENMAREKLEEFKYNELAVIRDYFGIPEKKAPPKITSVNQAIYKQLRTHLDSAMKEYRERTEQKNLEKVVPN